MTYFLKQTGITLSLALMVLMSCITDAEAKRFGGGKSSGMQRSNQQYNRPDTSPNSNAAQNTSQNSRTNDNKSAPSAGRNWMGPLAGIAAGLGIAALLSHLGLGEGMASIVTMLLFAGVAFIAIKFLLNAFRAKNPQAASAYSNSDNKSAYSMDMGSAHSEPNPHSNHPMHSSIDSVDSLASSDKNSTTAEADEFLRVAKSFFFRLQAANDKKDMDDLRTFLTPEMFAEAQLQILERGSETQTTDILTLNTELLGLVTENDTHKIGTVRFTGRSKCSTDLAAEDFSEIWHFTQWKNQADKWTLSGIQQD